MVALKASIKNFQYDLWILEYKIAYTYQVILEYKISGVEDDEFALDCVGWYISICLGVG